MIRKVLVAILLIVPIVALAQTKPKKITTKSDNFEIQDLANQTDRAFDECYLRLRTAKDVLTATKRIDTDTIKNESASFLMLMPKLGGVHIRPYTSVAGITPAELRLYEDRTNGTGYSGFKALTSLTGTSVSWALPDGDGASDQVMTTDGSGGLAWSNNYNWSKMGDTLFQHVFDTVIGAGSNTFTLPIAYTSATSYRVSCSPARINLTTLGEINNGPGGANQWHIIGVNNSTSSTFTVSMFEYMDASGVGHAPGVTDSVTCSCVASGR